MFCVGVVLFVDVTDDIGVKQETGAAFTVLTRHPAVSGDVASVKQLMEQPECVTAGEKVCVTAQPVQEFTADTL